MAVAIPPGKTFFDTLQRSFDQVPIDAANDNGISTTEFLEAAEALVTLFGMSTCPMELNGGFRGRTKRY